MNLKSDLKELRKIDINKLTQKEYKKLLKFKESLYNEYKGSKWLGEPKRVHEVKKKYFYLLRILKRYKENYGKTVS